MSTMRTAREKAQDPLRLLAAKEMEGYTPLNRRPAGPGNRVPLSGPRVSGPPWPGWSAGGWHARGLSIGSRTWSSSTTYRFPVDCGQ